MNNIFMLFLMIFNHIIADYNLQGVLAKMKQRDFWKDKTYYKNDFIAPLLCHSFCWSFMIMLPVALKVGLFVDFHYVTLLIANTILHAIIDHMKANMYLINLNVDQLLHMIQIILTFICVI